MFTEVKAWERAVRVCVQRVCAPGAPQTWQLWVGAELGSQLSFTCCPPALREPSPVPDNAPGLPLSLAFSGCEQLSRAGAPEATVRGAGWGLGAPSRGRATPAHCHHCCLCPAGSRHCGGSPLWTKSAPGPCHPAHRATSPKARGRHLPYPLAGSGAPGQS